MRAIAVVSVLAALAMPALADYFVAGSFQGWNPSDPAYVMADMGGWYQYTVLGATGRHEWKVTVGDWSQTWPGNNARADFGADGTFTINFYPGAQGDGWFPPENRVGYVDKGLHGWDVMGSFNGWSAPVVTLSALGSGLYGGGYVVPTMGTYYFKFRKEGDWDISIGSDFSNYGYDITWTTTADNEPLYFLLDLPNGRWNVIPEPASLLGLALLGLFIRRR
ncbi:MAG: PEP-CTERM sorting domain-containing protein [Phycisphaerae bacterium]|nr:PEP-CTERM sorting domain-containing protein [Phycisphaerae bacterium]